MHTVPLSATELPEFVRQRQAALVARDWLALAAQLEEELMYVHATGARHGKSAYLEFVREHLRFLSISMEEPSVFASDEICVVTGLLKQTLLRIGEATPVEAVSWATEVWRFTGTWRLYAFQSTRVASL